MDTLREVTDRFSLFNDGRKIGANKRKYIVSAVQNMIASDATQEALRLGEAYGYWGHQARQRANKLNIGETEVIMIGGKPVVVENIPSNRTSALSCSDEGVVSHTEQILRTETGKIVDSMEVSKAGGWSWATGGIDTQQASITNSYHGCDWVLKPNYLSIDHPAMMMESAEQRETMLLESLQEKGGFDAESAGNIIASMNKDIFNPFREQELENQVMYLEGVNAEVELRAQSAESESARVKNMLLESVNRLPIFLTEEQKLALSSLETDHDLQVIQAMFESIGAKKLTTLPTGLFQETDKIKTTVPDDIKRHVVKFDSGRRFNK